MKVRYRFRFYPTKEQESTLSRTFGAVRYVYNWGLRARTDAHQTGESLNYNQSSAALTALKKQPGQEWMKEISSVPMQQTLRHLQTAFRGFFDKRTRYPKFKSKRGKQSAEYTTSAFKYDPESKTLTIAKLGKLKVKWSREFQSEPSTITITKDRAGRYFVTLVLDETFEQLPQSGESVGIDLGINRLATLSTGELIQNPRWFRSGQAKLARAQRSLSRKKKGSGRYSRQRVKVARLHAKIADSRSDYNHKWTTRIVQENDTIAAEDLFVRGMVRSNLGKSLHDAALGDILRMLEYKSKRYGREFVQVDRFFPSSKRCFEGGWINTELKRSDKFWTCKCGARHDRDLNASRNILAAGHAVSARGADVRPSLVAVCGEA